MTRTFNFIINFIFIFTFIMIVNFVFIESIKQESKTYTPTTEKEIEFNKDLKEKVIFYSKNK